MKHQGQEEALCASLTRPFSSLRAASRHRALAAAVCIGLFSKAALAATVHVWDAGGGAATGWITTTNWNPDAAQTFVAGDTFNLSTVNIAAASTSTVTNSVTLGVITIGDTNATHAWTLALGASVITLDNAGSNAQINLTTNSAGDTISSNAGAGLALMGNLDITNSTTNKTLTISADITSSALSGTQTITNIANPGGITVITGVIGNGITGGKIALVSNGGILTLSGNNTFSGGVTLNGGTLNLNTTIGNPSFSSIGTGTLVINGGTIGNTSGGGVVVTTNNLQNWNGDFGFAGGMPLDLGTGAVTMSQSRVITIKSAQTFTVGGNISGVGSSLNTYGGSSAQNGTLVLSGTANTYSGGTNINGGIVKFNAAGSIPSTGTIYVGSSGALSVSGARTTLAAWLGDARLSTSSNGALGLTAASAEAFNPGALGFSTLSLGASTGFTVPYTGAYTPAGGNYFVGGGGGTIQFINANTFTGANNLVIGNGGGGTVNINVSNSYSGATQIKSGTFLLDSTGAMPNSTVLELGGGSSGTAIFSVATRTTNLTFAATAFHAGLDGYVVANNVAANTVAMGALTRDVGAAVYFGAATANTLITTTTANANFTDGQQTILGGWAIVRNGNDANWAISGTGPTPGTITPLSIYTAATAGGFTAGKDISVAVANVTVSSSTTINSLKFLQISLNSTITINAALKIATGGIIICDAGSNGKTFNGSGTLTSGNGQDLVIFMSESGSGYPVALSTQIVGDIGLTLVGTASRGVVTLGAPSGFTPSTFTGETNILGSGGAVTELILGNSLSLQNSTLNWNNQGGTGTQGANGVFSFGTLTSATFGGLKGSQNFALLNNAASPAAVSLSLGNNNQDTTFSGSLTGAGGSITKIGTGKLTLSGVNTYTGPTLVSNGILNINGSVTSNVTVNAAGKLMGKGTIVGNTSLVGIVAPGNSIGVLTVTGNFTFGATSIYQVEIGSGANNADRIDIGGSATVVAGATISLSQLSLPNQVKYVIATAASGLDSTFTNVIGMPAGFHLNYSPTELSLLNSAAISPTINFVADSNNGLNVRPGTQTIGVNIYNSAVGGGETATYSLATTGSTTLNGATGARPADAGLGSDHQTGTYTAALGPNSFTVSITNTGSNTWNNAPAPVLFSQTAYDIANATYTGGNIAFGNVRAGDSVAAQTIAFGNQTVTNASYQDTLDVSATTGNTRVTATGFTGLAASAGGVTTSNLVVTANTATAGSLASTAALTLVSNVNGLIGLTNTTATVVGSPASITTTGGVYDYANASVPVLTINFGSVHAGATVLPQAVSVENPTITNASFQDSLDASLGTPSNAGILANGGPINVAAGGSDSSTFTIGINTASAGSRNGTVTVNLTSNANGVPGLSNTALSAQTVTVTGNVYSGLGTWTGASSGNWNNSANWEASGGVPGIDGPLSTNDTATFGDNAVSGLITVTLNTNPSLASMTFNTHGAYTLTAGAGNTIALSGTTAINTGGALTVGAGVTLNGGGGVTVDGSLTVAGTIAKSVTVHTGGTLNCSQSAGLGFITGQANINSGGNLAVVSGATLSINTLTVNADSNGLTGSNLTFALSGLPNGTANPLLNVLSNNAFIANGSGLTNIVLTGSPQPGTYDLIGYAGTSSAFATLNPVVSGPGPFTYTLVNNTGANQIDLTVSVATLTWTGQVGGTGAANSNWNTTGTTNWTIGASPTSFFDGSIVKFQDVNDANSPNLVSNSVVLVQANGVAPSSVEFSNSSSVAYTLLSADANGIKGFASVLLSGTGTVTLNGANTYTGGTTINSGKLIVGNPGALGASGRTLIINGGIVDLATDTSVNAWTTTINNTATIISDIASGTLGTTHALGTLSINGSTLNVLGGVLINSGTAGLSFGSTSITGNPTFNITNPLSGGATSLSLGALDDGGAGRTFTKTGNGALTLTAPAVSLINGTIVNLLAGTLNVNAAGALGSLAALDMADGASFNVGANQTLGALTNAAAILNNSSVGIGVGATLTIGSSNNLNSSFTGFINGTSGGLTKAGTGTLVLTNANTYGGLTTILDGNLILLGSNSSTGGTTLSGGKLQLDGAAPNPLASGTLTLNGGTLQVNNSGHALANTTVVTNSTTLSGAVNFAMSGSITNSAGNNTFTNNLAPGSLLTLSNNIYLAENNSSSRTFTLAGTGDTTISGNISNNSGAHTLASSFTITNTGITTLLGTSTYTGTFTIAGGNVRATNLNLSTLGSFAFNSGTLTIDGGVFTPKQGSVTWFYSPTLSNTYAASNAVSGAAGTSDRPKLSLKNGATATGIYVNNGNNGSWLIGVAGGKGDATVDGSAGVNFSLLASPANSGFVRIGTGAATILGTVYRSEGTLSITNGAHVRSFDTASIGMDGGKGSATVDGAGSLLQSVNNEFRIGAYRYDNGPTNFGEGTLALTNGGQAKSATSIYVGNQGGKGTVTIDGVGSLLQNTGYYMYIGETRFDATAGTNSDATVTLTNGGQAKSDGLIAIGDYGGKGKVTIDGVGSLMQSAVAQFYIGSTRFDAAVNNGSDGTLIITNGGQAIWRTSSYVGGGGGKGIVTVDGIGSLFQSTNGGLYVGQSRFDASASNYGDGTLNVTNGAQVKLDGLLAIGDFGGKGKLNVDGAGSLVQSINDTFYFGSNRYDTGVNNYGDAIVNITNGAWAICRNNAFIGNDGGICTTTVDGAGSLLQVANGSMLVGSFNGYSIASNKGFSQGTLILSNGGLAKSFTNTLIGSKGNSGTITVSSNSTLDVTGDLSLGANGSTTVASSISILNINPTALVKAGGTTYTYQMSNSSTINLQGGTLQTGAFDRSGGGTLNWTSGTLSITGGVGMTLSTANLGTPFSLGANRTLNITNTFSLPNAANFAVGGGTLNAGALANQGTFAVNSGTATTGAITGGGTSTVAAGGILTATSITQAALTVSGTVKVLANGGSTGLSVLKSLTLPVDGLGNPVGNLDLNDNDLVVDYTAGGVSPFATIRSQVKYGLTYITGITSTTGKVAPFDKVLAVVDNVNHGLTSLSGVTLASLGLTGTMQVLGKYTYFGDANLDGKVTGTDYTFVDAYLGHGDTIPDPNVDWLNGDFNLDGKVTGADYAFIDSNLGKGVAVPLGFEELQTDMIALHTAEYGAEYTAALESFQSSVPEPTSLGLLGLGAVALLGRRRGKKGSA